MLKLKKEDYPQPESGTYIAEVFKIDDFTSDKHPEFGTSIRFSFKILEEPYVGVLVSGLCSATWRPGSKLDKWLTGLGVNSTEIGTELDADKLKGLKARIVIEKNPKSEFVNVKYVTALRPNELAALSGGVNAAPVSYTAPAPVQQAPVAPPTQASAPVAPQQQNQTPQTPRRTIPF